MTDNSFLLLLNAHDEQIDWTLPSEWERPWQVAICTAADVKEGEPVDGEVAVPARSVIVLSDAVSA